jgi:hypothetical protein
VEEAQDPAPEELDRDVRSWQTVEPAIDFTAAAALAFALEATP